MTELNGLRNLVNTAGTVHSIQPPPERDDFDSETAWAEAVDEWWLTTNTWTTTRNYRAEVSDPDAPVEHDPR